MVASSLDPIRPSLRLLSRDRIFRWERWESPVDLIVP